MPIVTDRLTKLTIDKKVIENQELAQELDELAKGVYAVIERVAISSPQSYRRIRTVERLTEALNILWDVALVLGHPQTGPGEGG